MVSYGSIFGVLPFRFIASRKVEQALNGEYAGAQPNLLSLPWQAFKADVFVWVGAGIVMVIIYYIYFLPYAASSIKVMAGCAALGIFCGMLS